MRDYQLQKGEHTMPYSCYRRTVAAIRDVPRLREMVDDMIDATPERDTNGGGRSSTTSNPTESIAIRISVPMRDIRAIEGALEVVPAAYREAIWWNIMTGRAYPPKLSKRTAGRYKQKYVYEVAQRLGYILN